jgi:hypothetical protein
MLPYLLSMNMSIEDWIVKVVRIDVGIHMQTMIRRSRVMSEAMERTVKVEKGK